MNDSDRSESSAEVKKRVNAARSFRRERLAALGLDADSPEADKKEACAFSHEAEEVLKKAFDSLSLSARGYMRTVRVSRTIADLDASHAVMPCHVYEAIRLRQLDRKYFGNL